LSFRMTWT